MSEAHHHEPFPVEQEQPDNGRLFVYGVCIALIFFGLGISITMVFFRANQHLIQERAAQPGLDLQALRAQEETALTTYGWVDQAKGQVRIPIERAMRLVVEEHQKK